MKDSPRVQQMRVWVRMKPRERKTAERKKRFNFKDILGGPGTSLIEFHLRRGSLVLMKQLSAVLMMLQVKITATVGWN